MRPNQLLLVFTLLCVFGVFLDVHVSRENSGSSTGSTFNRRPATRIDSVPKLESSLTVINTVLVMLNSTDPEPTVGGAPMMIEGMMPNRNRGAFLHVKGYPIERIISSIRSNRPLRKLTFAPVSANARRKIWIDVGARQFPSGSTQWFLRNFPNASSFDGFAFDLLDLKSDYPVGGTPGFFRNFTYVVGAAWTHDNGVHISGRKMGRVDDGRSDRRQKWLSPSVDVSRFLLDTYSSADHIVMKMDIEGGEWILLPHMLKTGALALVSDLLLECHSTRPVASRFKLLPAECIDLVNFLRNRSIRCHVWV